MITSYSALLWPGSTVTALYMLVLVAIILALVVSLYRLFLHPLRAVPGPKLAAVTDFYRFYFDVFGDGMVKTIPELHERYHSTVVRIGPNYVHVQDPQDYHKIFSRNSPFLKWGGFWHNRGGAALILSVTDPKRHRTMRAVMNPFFSKGAADRLAKGFVRRLNKASDIMMQQSQDGAPIDLLNLYRSLTCNTVAEVLLGESELVPTGHRSDLLGVMDEIGSRSLLLLNFPFLQLVGAKIPPSIVDSLAPGLGFLREKCDALIEKSHARGRDTPSAEKPCSMCEMLVEKNPVGALSTDMHRDLMQHMLQFLVPNTDSSAVTLSAAIFQVSQSPAMRHRLRSELVNYTLDSDDWSSLMQLPYLTAVVKETLRMYPGLPGLLPRVVPTGGYTVGEQYLPAGTTIAASIYALHQNDKAYSEPTKFIPERWLVASNNDRDRCFAPFQKGNHACIGTNLAYMQLYLGIAHMIKRFDLHLCEPVSSEWQWIDRAGAKPAWPVFTRVVKDHASTQASHRSVTGV
ncbi:hypothetical protein EYZ11_010149 [Aspergillus tanneri]|uniref:Cytochrome P450 n=1 Tax=Aspergillus tanneri TaxID=1220188 RepID=A0A4S3J618_9EURO|nr:hypothetical protein EYZ11_010149 [Aspergillus tanneri]